MGAYLQIRAAGYTLLVDSAHVRDVMANRGENNDGDRNDSGSIPPVSPGHRIWRGQALPTLDLPEALGGSRTPRPVALVLGDAGEAAIILDVDGAGPLHRLEDADFRRLPPLPSAAERTFDALLVTGDGQAGMLRLRRGAVSALLPSLSME
jgi:hypothetical protein